MASMTSPLTKSKPCLFLPFTHAKKLGSPPAILLNYGHYNPNTKKALQVVADADNAPLSEVDEPRYLGKIFLSDVVVRRRTRSFKLPKWLEYFFAYLGVQALQRDPIFWVSTHRHHHQFCDSERDPHSPTEGFWFSHINWLFDNNYITEKVCTFILHTRTQMNKLPSVN
ncbi:hypothetical protein NC651_027568 [Populus alba x Populus x berolinensis]|nr:hypothetical protein NC651_027568 [Populus alba x Populus x berolinensis]